MLRRGLEQGKGFETSAQSLAAVALLHDDLLLILHSYATPARPSGPTSCAWRGAARLAQRHNEGLKAAADRVLNTTWQATMCRSCANMDLH